MFIATNLKIIQIHKVTYQNNQIEWDQTVKPINNIIQIHTIQVILYKWCINGIANNKHTDIIAIYQGGVL